MGRRYHGERVWEWGGGIMGGGCGSREEGDSTKAKIESHNYQFSYNIIISKWPKTIQLYTVI